MGLIKELLYRLLGPGIYLRLISGLFIFLYKSGFLSLFGVFPVHHFVTGLVNDGDHVIDIGANLGYFTTIFAKRAGTEGKIIAVEPVEPYRRILQRNCRNYKNVQIIPFALGAEDGEAWMGIPNRYLSRHGLTRILKDNDPGSGGAKFRVWVRNPGILFKNITRLDYIKCDIEGYEVVVIPQLQPVIEKFLPLIQIEISDQSIDEITGFLTNFGYGHFYLKDGKLERFSGTFESDGDSFFLTADHIRKFQNIVR